MIGVCVLTQPFYVQYDVRPCLGLYYQMGFITPETFLVVLPTGVIVVIGAGKFAWNFDDGPSALNTLVRTKCFELGVAFRMNLSLRFDRIITS